jgi:subtilisin family serine protease
MTSKVVKEITINDSLIDNATWLYKDIIKDSISGISLEKAKNTILKNKTGREIIVAVIDSKFDINHEVLKDYIWTNPKEILNYKDDDNNGFVDDIYGWNFIGNSQGENVIDANYEYVRYIRHYSGRFENKTIDNVKEGDKEKFILYIEVKEKLETELIKAKNRLDYSNNIFEKYVEARDALQSYFPNYNYTLDVLNEIDTTGNNLATHVKEISEVIKWGETNEMNVSTNTSYKSGLNKHLNIDFNERSLVGDNPYDINDTIYGNNKTFNFLKHYDHGTRVSSVITNLFKYSSSKLKILPISISPAGSYHDKDLALAIRYAVNNGAKVINMSFAKEYSINKEWVFEAFKYAEKHNVVIVRAAGNDSYDLGNYNITYPMDNENNGKEVSDNFLLVGSSTYKANENLKANFSSYGKNDVDVFAPGDNLFTAKPFNKYMLDRGTSLSAALISGVAALLFSHYPNLTASQVKHIIMDSGIEYTFPVKTPTKEDKDKMTPFNQLSKSGKVVNAYNALIMADSISKINKSR